MKRDTKKQLFAIFIVLMFFGSGFAFAIISAFPSDQPAPQYIFSEPLTNTQEAAFLQNNMVIIKYFYTEDCVDCQNVSAVVAELFQDLYGGIVIEEINMDDFSDHAEALGIETAPTLYLKGNKIEKIEGKVEYLDLYEKICHLFFQPVEKCYLFY